MPRIKTGETTEEEIEEWLGRLEEEEPLPDSYDDFVRILRGELTMTDGSVLDYNDTQIEALWNAKQDEVDMSEHGIHGVVVKYPWGIEMRYGVQGMSGLFGWNTVQIIREEEGW